jgi:hypothetical protein
MSTAEELYSATVIPAGYDFFQTQPGNAVMMFNRFPIPASFFSPRSLPFARVVRFQGRPLPRSYFNNIVITHIDTIIERKTPAEFRPPYPQSREVPIEIIGLALESMKPLEVQVGRRFELWDAFVELSRERPSVGRMIITKARAEGGTFDSELAVFPLFRFVRLCDGKERILDVGALSLTDELVGMLTMHSTNTSWLHVAPHALRLEGLNDNFVAGAPGILDEESGATIHNVDEGGSCEVVIRADSHCLTLGRNRVYAAEGSPDGGTYQWTITMGAGRATIVSAANQQGVIVQGRAVSGASNDITLQVEYVTPGGDSCFKSISLTVVEVQLSLRKSGSFEMSNGVLPQVALGGDQLGPVSPGNPPGCVGFFKKVEIKGTVQPNDPGLDCTFRFRNRRQGRAGYIVAGAFFRDEDKDCPAGCPDDPDPGVGEETTMSPEGTIYFVDAPGEYLPQGNICTRIDEISINCMNFSTWVEADGQPCTPEFSWFAVTRLRCNGTAWVSEDPTDPVDTGTTQCAVPPEGGLIGPADVSRIIALLRSDSVGDRLLAQQAVIRTLESQVDGVDRQRLIGQLRQIAEGHAQQYDVYSPEMLALNLLGLLHAQDGIEALMNHLLTRFPQSIVSHRDLPPATVASKALANLGTAAVTTIIEKAPSASDEEWDVLAHTLRSIDDRHAVRRSICATLDSHLDERADERLDIALHGLERL